MHTRTICYNLEDHIKYFVDGANKESGVTLPAQMEEGILIFKNLYSKYNIDYYNPVYNEVRTDKVCYELGLSNKKEKNFHKNIFFTKLIPHVGTVLFIIYMYVTISSQNLASENIKKMPKNTLMINY